MLSTAAVGDSNPGVEAWLVACALGGQRPLSLSVGQDSRGLVPWAGIAANLTAPRGQQPSGDDSAVSRRPEGQAFCFLPLPVHTGLPVHVNGYFELSSNRRDIWFGTDMTGAGRMRSEWNLALLEVLPSLS